jgi:hypothetical protein
MKNPDPIARARRIEMRRKKLGFPSRCFYCDETRVFCFEEDHPVTRELDEKLKRVVCRNCHRMREAERDIKGLTKNGQHDVVESEIEKLRRYFLLMAEDEELQAELLQSTPDTPINLIITASQARAASFRRKALALSLSNLPVAAQRPD